MYFYELILYFVEFFKFAVVYRLAFDFEWRKRWYVFLCDVVILCAGAAYYTWWEYRWNPMLIYVCGFALLSIINFKNIGKWTRFIGIFGWTVITTTLIDSMAYLMLSYENNNWNHLGASIITIVFFMLCLGMVKRKRGGILRKISPGYYIAFTLIGFVNQIVLSFLYEEATKESRLIFPFAIIVLGVFLQMLTVFVLAVANQTWKEKEQLNKEYLSALEQHYQYIGKKEGEIKKFRHDIRNHLYTLDELIRQGREEEYHCYMKEIFGILEMPSNFVDTGNSVVDAIINQYADTFSKEGITLQIDGHLPVGCFIKSFDLCIIFSNMLQNALEAVRKCEKREIEITLRYDEYGVYIYQKNTYKTVIIKGNRLVTSKEDSTVHGVGSVNMRESIEKYKGTIEYKAKDHWFGLTIWLQQPQYNENEERA